MKGIIYIRVSSDEQVKGTSLEFQEELCRKYGEQKGIEIVNIFREEGESAKDLSLNNRKKFLAALEFCRKNKNQIQAFIVLRVDRFARNTEDHFAVRKILLEYGTTLYSVTEPIGNKPAEKFIETVLAGAAEYDNAIRKQRCSDGMLARIKQGIYPFKPPIGYKCAHFKKRGEKKTSPDPPDEITFPIIQKALKEFTRGIYQQKQILEMLINLGLKTASGRTPDLQLVGKMLRKYLKFYAGIIVNPWTGEEVEGLHQPMITKEEMSQIQLILSGKSKSVSLKHQRYNPDFPLRGTVVCGSCNHLLTGSSPRGNGGRYFYYHCRNRTCSMYGKGISKNILENEFSEYLRKVTPKEKWLSVFKETLLDLWAKKGRSNETEIKRHKIMLSSLEEKRKRVFEMREEGSYTKEEFRERKNEIDSEIAASKLAQNTLQTDDYDVPGVLTFAMDFILSMAQKWQIMPPLQRSRFQELVFPQGISYIRNQGFGTTKMAYIFELIKGFRGYNSPTVDLSKINWNRVVTELYKWNKLAREYQESSEISKVA